MNETTKSIVSVGTLILVAHLTVLSFMSSLSGEMNRDAARMRVQVTSR